MTLVDSSAWIEMFRKRQPLDLSLYTPFDEIVTCLPIVQEVLQGFREEAPYRVAREAMLALPIVESPIRLDLIEEAASLFRVARRRGLTVRSSIDCLIAACALRHDLEILHRDRDSRSSHGSPRCGNARSEPGATVVHEKRHDRRRFGGELTGAVTRTCARARRRPS